MKEHNLIIQVLQGFASNSDPTYNIQGNEWCVGKVVFFFFFRKSVYFIYVLDETQPSCGELHTLF